MPAPVNAVATSFDLPNFIGELWQKGRRPNAMLQLIGDPTVNAAGIRYIGSTQFAMGVDFALPAPAQPAILQGAAPTMQELPTEQETNVVQIFQRGVGLTYSRMGDTDQIDGLAVVPGGGSGPLNAQEASLDRQIQLQLLAMAQDLNTTFLNGAYVLAGSSATAYKTRGLLTAIATHSFKNGGVARALTTGLVDTALQTMVADGAFLQGDVIYALAPATEFANLINAYYVPQQQPRSFDVSGTKVAEIYTKWATIVPKWDPDMPAGQIAFVQAQHCRPVMKVIPKKGAIFAEPLSKTGSQEQWQVYGEIGLDYTSEYLHGVLGDLS